MNTTSRVDADFHRVAELGDRILPQINAIREAGPVVWSENARAWVIARHADVVEAYSGRLPLSNVRYHPLFAAVPEAERSQRFPSTMRTIGVWPVFTDPPLHTRLRKLLTRAFGRPVVEDQRPYVRETIRRVLDRAGAKGEVEFVNEVARAITGRVIMRLLGIPEDYLPRLETWSLTINEALGGAKSSPVALDAMERTVAEMSELFEKEIEKRRARPTQDFLSEMVLAREGCLLYTSPSPRD